MKRKELTPRMHQVVQFLFEHPDWTQKQIGQAIGISDQRVSQIMSSNRVLEAFPTLARSRIKGMVPDAVKRYRELLRQQDNPEVARKVADRLLDTHKVLDPEVRVVRHELEIMSTEKVAAWVRDSLKLSQNNIVEAEIVTNSDEEIEPE